jgi:hypothetical protein
MCVTTCTDFHGNNLFPRRRAQPLAINRFQDFSGSGANVYGFREVRPADDAVRVDQELSRAGNVGALRAAARVKEVVPANDLGFRVGKESVGVALLAAMLAVGLGRVHADGGYADTAGGEFWEMVFKTPQLGVAEGSPGAPVENQKDRVGLVPCDGGVRRGSEQT